MSLHKSVRYWRLRRFWWDLAVFVLPMSWLYRHCQPLCFAIWIGSYGAWERWRMTRDGWEWWDR